MSAVAKIAALLETLNPADLATLAPAERRHFAALCRFLAEKADPQQATPKAGVLAEVGRHGVHAE